MKPAIRIENLSKQYRLGLVGTGTLSHDLKRWWHIIRGKEDPYLKIGETNDRSKKGNSEYVWALKDINLEVMPGEVLGIIGKNGAGKSTLLKILSKVTGPTTGSITYKGRIGSLLEVGTGFHPELTGRENIYLNGAILGMRKKEIDRKFDEIVDFSGVERYIDTPTKRYSSGMTVRLGFAVAAFLEPEILVVDEVLAVGDAEFQKKAIGKMQDVSKNEGRTVLFVSHNMGAVQNLCIKSLLIEEGNLIFIGDTTKTIDYYLSNGNKKEDDLLLRTDRYGSGDIRINKIKVYDKDDNEINEVLAGQKIKLRLYYINESKKSIPLIPAISITNQFDQMIYSHHSRLNGIVFSEYNNEGYFEIEMDDLAIVPGLYNLSYYLLNNGNFIDGIKNVRKISVISSNYYGSAEIPPSSHTQVLIKGLWRCF